MKRLFAGVALCAALTTGAAHAAVTEANFGVRNTGDLLELCTATQPDPMFTAASNFCHGFAVGVYRVLEEINMARRTRQLFCMPNPPPSRSEEIAAFAQWARANPDQMTQPAADGIAKFLSQQFPCGRGK
jgi:Ssp1 endopeptidase immunity protein Rap1a